MCDCEPGEAGYCSDCELMELQAEHHRLRSRCRKAAQTLIAAVGAPGPMDVEESAERAVARIAELEAAVGARAAELMELSLEAEGDTQLIARQADLLRGVVDAIRGPHPDPLARWGVHDAHELAAALAAALRNLVADLDDLECLGVRFPNLECPECEDDSDRAAQLTKLCPYHAAKRMLGGDGG